MYLFCDDFILKTLGDILSDKYFNHFTFAVLLDIITVSMGKPRGARSAYAFFVQTHTKEHKKEHPDEPVVFAEFSKKCAEKWKVLRV